MYHLYWQHIFGIYAMAGDEREQGKELRIMKMVIKNRKKRKRYVKASMTLEASFLVPIILFTIVGGINIGYRMLQETKGIIQIHEELEKLDPVELVRTKTLIRGLTDQ